MTTTKCSNKIKKLPQDLKFVKNDLEQFFYEFFVGNKC